MFYDPRQWRLTHRVHNPEVDGRASGEEEKLGSPDDDVAAQFPEDKGAKYWDRPWTEPGRPSLRKPPDDPARRQVAQQATALGLQKDRQAQARELQPGLIPGHRG